MTARDSGPLSGTVVVGLEHSVAGPLCTRILADLGARVIKVERAPGGDFSRHWDDHAQGEGVQYWWLNRRKESVMADLRSPEGRALLDALLDRADVLVHNMSPSAARRLGLAEPAFDERYPRLVHCHISGYGSDGSLRDRKAYDMLVQAEAGLMSLTGTPEQPMRIGVSVCDVGTGVYAAALVLGALMEQRATGRGRRLELTMFDAAVELLAPMLLSYANAGVTYTRSPERHPAITPYGAFRCRDGRQVLIAVEQDHEWRRVCEHLLGDPGLADDPRYATNLLRREHRDEVDSRLARVFSQLSRAEAVALLERLDLAYACLNDVAGVAEHPVTLERGILSTVMSASGAEVTTIVGIAERLLGSPEGRVRAPALGEDTEAVRSELGLGAAATSIEERT